MIRVYKGHAVEISPAFADGGNVATSASYTIDGTTTAMGRRRRPTLRAAWKAAKAEIARAWKCPHCGQIPGCDCPPHCPHCPSLIYTPRA